MTTTLPLRCLVAAKRLGIPFTKDLLWVSIRRARMWHFAIPRSSTSHQHEQLRPDYQLRHHYTVSTSRFGIGQDAGSNFTPLGLHRIAEKIGGGWPVGTVFKNRRMVGYTWKGLPLAGITTRILWLDGLEPGFNRGGTVDSHSRYIYIHGTGDELTLGRPASHGCIHLSADDLVPLFNRIPSGTLVWIER